MYQQGDGFLDQTYNKVDAQNIKTIPKKKGQITNIKTISETPHVFKKQIYIPTSLKAMHQYQLQLLNQDLELNNNKQQVFKQSQYGLGTYVVIAKIQSINNQGNKYIFKINDETLNPQKISIQYPKTSIQTTLTSLLKKGSKMSQFQNISSLSFESNPIDGQPYFRLWLKMVLDKSENQTRIRWNLEKVDRIKEYDELAFHNCAAMLFQLNPHL